MKSGQRLNENIWRRQQMYCLHHHVIILEIKTIKR